MKLKCLNPVVILILSVATICSRAHNIKTIYIRLPEPYIYIQSRLSDSFPWKEKDDGIDTRLSIALNSGLQENTLQQLSGSNDWNVRYGVARNLNTPPDILSKLSADPDFRVRQGVAENWNTSRQIQETLSKDNNLYVRWAVSRTINGTVDNYNFSPEYADIVKTGGGTFYEKIKDRLEDSKSPEGERKVTAANEIKRESPRTNPIEYEKVRIATVNRNKRRVISNRLSEGGNSFMEWEVAKDTNTPEDILATLAESDDSEVRWSVAENPNTPQDVLEFLSTDRSDNVRWVVSENPNTPQDILVALAKDTNADVRWGVANNPNTPLEILRILSEDNDRNVRAGAVKNLNR